MLQSSVFRWNIAEANMYTIREVDANDKANFILSPNLFDVAKSKGWSLDAER